jgi:hypothetical protein
MTARNFRNLEENLKNELQVYLPSTIFYDEMVSRAKLSDVEKLRSETKIYAKENDMNR